MNEYPRTSLAEQQKDSSYSQFSEGCHKEREGDVIVIYDPSKTKRWYVFRYTDHEKKDRLILELQGRAGEAWHLLMGVSQAKDAATRKELSAWVSIDVIEDDAFLRQDKTGSRMYFYATEKNEVRTEGWAGGYWKPKEEVAKDLQEHHPIALSKEHLPPKIDVKATGLQLIKRFNEGRFDPPAFVLQQEPSPTRSIQRIPQLLRRLLRTKSTAIQKA